MDLLLPPQDSHFPLHVLQHSRPGRKIDSFHYRSYDHDKRFCLLKCLKRRGKRFLSQTVKLLITVGKPYREASQDTMRRCIKTLFLDKKILKDLTPRSFRSASTSNAIMLNVHDDKILKKKCWKSEKTYRRCYENALWTR